MKRAAIYARYSTDLQNDLSVDDQIEFCRRYAERMGYAVIEAYDDRALSGRSMVRRDGINRLMRDSKLGNFEIVLTENTARLSRDFVDLPSIYKRLTYLDISVVNATTGIPLTMTQAAFDGVSNQQQRESSASQARRGAEGAVRRGKIIGIAYGYLPNPKRTPDRHCEYRGRHIIDETAAPIITEIFERFADGEQPRAIAGDLNRRGIPSPRGGKWNASTINGNPVRGSGILRNEVYAGRYRYGKVKMVYDPDTDSRLSRRGAAEMQTVGEVPHLAIVSPKLFDRVQALIAERSRPHPGGSKPVYLLSTILKCGACGAGMTRKGGKTGGKARVTCSAHQESGTCPDPRGYPAETIETMFLDTFKSELRSPRAIKAFIDEFTATRRRRVSEKTQERARIERELSTATANADRLHGYLVKGIGDVERIDAEIKLIVAREKELKATLVALDTPEPDVVDLHPKALQTYLDAIDNLRELIGKSADSNAAKMLRQVVEAVILHPSKEPPRKGIPNKIDMEIRGRLEALIGAPDIQRAKFAQGSFSNGSSGQI